MASTSFASNAEDQGSSMVCRMVEARPIWPGPRMRASKVTRVYSGFGAAACCSRLERASCTKKTAVAETHMKKRRSAPRPRASYLLYLLNLLTDLNLTVM